MNYLLMFILLMINSGGRDLLDFVPTEAYWKEKGVTVKAETMLGEIKEVPADKAPDISAFMKDLASDDFKVRRQARKKIAELGPAVIPQLQEGLKSTDPEVKTACRELIESCTSGGKAGDVRKLMAIRTLGELKAKDAVPALQKLADSKEPFVGEYAKAALAAIEGKEYKRPGPTAEELKSDYMLFPEGMGMIGQATGPAGGRAPLEDIVKNFSFMFGRGMNGGAEPVGDLVGETVKRIISMAEISGNLRIDAFTMGISGKIGNQEGFVMFIARGQYDPKAIGLLFQNNPAGGPGGGPELKSDVKDGIDVLVSTQPWERVGIAMPSATRMVWVVSPPRKGEETTALDDVIPLIKAGKGKVDKDEAMMAVLKKVDTKKPLWVAVNVTETYKQAPLFKPFDMLRAEGTVDDKGVLDVVIVGDGKDEVEVKKSVTMVNDGVKQLLKGEGGGPFFRVNDMPTVKAFFESIKCESDGKTATLTAKAEKGLIGILPFVR